MTSRAAHFSGFLAPARDAGTTDAELLDRFVAHRDGPAFAALVARHGPMVFGVCRRVVRDWHAAEDAFQAVFLVLARRAAAVSPPGAVAGWLHGVAYRVAKDARRAEFRRAARERPTAVVHEPAAPVGPDADLRAVLDDELRKLPRKYRDLLVACDLEECPRAPVAAALGIPDGTLSSRLTAARKMLAGRLAKRGVAPAVAAGVAVRGPALVACEVTRAVLTSAARLGCGGTDKVPASVNSLASGAIRTMTNRIAVPIAFLALSMCGSLGAVLATSSPLLPPDPPAPKVVVFATRPADPPAPKVAAKPSPKGPNKLIFTHDAQLTLIDPDGKNEKRLPAAGDKYQPSHARISPDGTMVAVLGMPKEDPTGAKKPSYSLYVRKLDGKEAGTDLGVQCQMIAWSPDGTELVCTDFDGGPNKPLEATHVVVNVKTRATTALKLPADHVVTDWSRDGKYFLTTSIVGGENDTLRLHLMNRDGTEHKALTEKSHVAMMGKLSPDGSRVLYTVLAPPPKDKPGPWKHELTVLDVATGKATKVEDVPLNADIQGYCWGPDSKRIAYVWRELHEGKPEEVNGKETESLLIVCDPTGQNQKTVATAKGKAQWQITIFGPDWR